MRSSWLARPLRFAALWLLIATPARAVAAEPLEDHPRVSRTPREEGERLQLLVGTGYLTSSGPGGGAVDAGLRTVVTTHTPWSWALSFDLGYSAFFARQGVQDRWWLMPDVALVHPVGIASLKAGAAAGLGAASGYSSAGDYAAGPFSPTWAYQLVPAFRLHVGASMPIGPRTEMFVRLDGAGLWMRGNSVGSRVGVADPGLGDVAWVDALVGVRFGVL